MPKTAQRSSSKPKRKRPSQNQAVTETDFARIEFHRHGLALFPDPADKRPGIALLVEDDSSGMTHRFCSCAVSEKRTCPHLQKLKKLQKALLKRLNEKTLEVDFRSSIWYRLAEILWEGSTETPESVHIHPVSLNGVRILRVSASSGQEMLRVHMDGGVRHRFLERCTRTEQKDAIPSRGDILDQLALMTYTPNERMMQERGFKTRRQDMEERFWYRLAYHGYREFGSEGCTFQPAIEESSGMFTVSVQDRDGNLQFRLIIPRDKVSQILRTFDELLPNGHGLPIHPIPLKSIFKVSRTTELDMEVRPLIRLFQENGESSFFEREDLEKFRYGNLFYIKEMDILCKLEPEGKTQRKFRAPIKMVLKKSQVPRFFEALADECAESSSLVDEHLESLHVVRSFERLEITPAQLERNWYWLSADYGFGNTSIGLADILSAKKEGRRYIGTPSGWVDCTAPELDGLNLIVDRYQTATSDPENTGRIGLSPIDLLRITVGMKGEVEISGGTHTQHILRRLFELKPIDTLPPPEGLKSSLRPYQALGVEWLRFLYENGFGGLLCDDMGLGKTHEVMAFLLGLREHAGIEAPFLVVCPTTVLSHWDQKVKAHAPALNPVVYHGGDRDIQEAIQDNALLLTSYGILRRDIAHLRETAFAVAVFDEIQHIKNPETHGYRAAAALRAGMRLGLTGTPVENCLMELKALLDLTVPGYLGSDHDFETRYVSPIELDTQSTKAETLSRLISPFILRRRKGTVLDDLPEKVEDLRTCRLSEDQVKLYRDAVAGKGKQLLQELEDQNKTIPYMHVFALLNLLKQICNHPGMLNHEDVDYRSYASGKWELFKEILSESLDSGQKVVVYSQFLYIIDIMAAYLEEAGIDFVALTGKTRNRGDVISRLNTDPNCRVYLGSLKAGGVGIDLVAASIVIHYDMWWNAAREDQATDRVHRIGQRRGVHVFKLITEGTLEEKIAAMVQKKRHLMDQVIKESDPTVLKGFSREELMELLSLPS